MKHLSHCFALLLAGCICVASAQPFPSKPVRIVIGFPAGGPLDQHARLLSDRLQQVLGQPVLIDYKSGAGGTVGAQDVMKAAPDGYTLMLANTGVMVINPAVYSRLPYGTLKDFVPIARTAMQPLALLVNPQVPVTNLKEFIDYARARPGQINYGSAGNGGISHLVPEMFKTSTGLTWKSCCLTRPATNVRYTPVITPMANEKPPFTSAASTSIAGAWGYWPRSGTFSVVSKRCEINRRLEPAT